jgi:hypothetical protein
MIMIPCIPFKACMPYYAFLIYCHAMRQVCADVPLFNSEPILFQYSMIRVDPRKEQHFLRLPTATMHLHSLTLSIYILNKNDFK